MRHFGLVLSAYNARRRSSIHFWHTIDALDDGDEMSRMQEAMGFRMGAIQESSRRKKLPLAKRIGRTDPCLSALFDSTRLTSCVITQATS